MFNTNDTAWFRIHKDDANLMRVIYQIASAYFEDEYADKLINKPFMTAILGKDALASQPTLSRYFNHMDIIHLKLLNIATKVVKSERYEYCKLCSSCPYKKEFYEALENT